MSNKNKSDRVFAYQAASCLTYDELQEVSGGAQAGKMEQSKGIYWTLYASAAAGVSQSGTPVGAMDGKWD